MNSFEKGPRPYMVADLETGKQWIAQRAADSAGGGL
jgi:hypothetical protein